MWPTWKEIKDLSNSYKTIRNGFFGKYEDLKIKLANQIIENGFEVLPIIYNTGGKLCSLYLRSQKNPRIASINNKKDLERFFCDMNYNVGFDDNQGWRHEFIVLDNMDNYQEFIIKKYKIKGDENESL